MKVYFDNAATTPMDPEVFEVMKPFLLEKYGNPSSTHSMGRQARAAIESSRKKIAELLQCLPSEIIFTSGGTEANNSLLQGAIEADKSPTIITSPTEHHSVLEKAKRLSLQGFKVEWLKVDPRGNMDYEHLRALLSQHPNSIVSLMHVNNEIGTISDLELISGLCNEYGAYFHTDAIAGVGHIVYDLQNTNIDGLSASAHKFHGPKGVGFMYINHKKRISPIFFGGPQERELRAGTENVAGIIGAAKALELSYNNLTHDSEFLTELKNRFTSQLFDKIPGIEFNGDPRTGLFTILNISLPVSLNNEMLLFNLDLQGISASGGSACSAGAEEDSHVLKAIGTVPERGAIRFSFGKYNTLREVDYVVDQLVELFTSD